MKDVVYAGVSTSLCVFSLEPRTGALEGRGAAKVAADIHYAAMHPSRKYLYVSASDRAQVNLVYAFGVDATTGALSPLGEPFSLPTTLGRAVHITVDNAGRYLLTANNLTESVGVLRLSADGRISDLIAQPEMPKLGFLVHQIRVDPTNRWVFVPVRGNDGVPEHIGRLHVFSFSGGMLKMHRTIDYEAGVGPRHLDFHPTQPWVYALAERGNQLITYKHDAGTLTELFRSTTLRDPSFTFPAQRAGAIHVHRNGRWIYATNRNVAPCPPSAPCPDRHAKPFAGGENNIAFFDVDTKTGRPILVEHVDSHGFEPRTFTIVPTGSVLIAANMMNIVRKDRDRLIDVLPNLSVFRIESDGKLTFVRSYDQPGGLVSWVGAYERPV
jgi:6-phosphogluconolactonase (cycloisomerase 2 family)